MPTYQYACTNAECENRFELVQSFTDPAASECPVCGSSVRKVYSAVGVVFKGTGFYRTDSRAADKTKTTSSSSPSEKSEKSTDSSSTKEPAPAAKFSSAPDSSSSNSSSTGKAAASA